MMGKMLCGEIIPTGANITVNGIDIFDFMNDTLTKVRDDNPSEVPYIRKIILKGRIVFTDDIDSAVIEQMLNLSGLYFSLSSRDLFYEDSRYFEDAVGSDWKIGEDNKNKVYLLDKIVAAKGMGIIFESYLCG